MAGVKRRLVVADPGAGSLYLGFCLGAVAAQGVGNTACLFAAIDGDGAAVSRKAISPAVGSALTGQIEQDSGVAVGARAGIMLDDKAEVIELVVDGS